jgi:EAL domain-containing protein (putative c-di-GMP-specific phosphodiesterase class I)
LKYLQQLKVGRVKMDRSFVCALDKDAASRAVVKAILDITQRLQVQTIAEGVEHEDIEKILRSMGCAEAQGALYGTPLKAQAFAKLYLPLNA